MCCLLLSVALKLEIDVMACCRSATVRPQHEHVNLQVRLDIGSVVETARCVDLQLHVTHAQAANVQEGTWVDKQKN